MKKSLLVILIVLLSIILLTGCANNNSSDNVDYSKSTSVDSLYENDQNGEIMAGQLTAAEWNDNNHYDEWVSLFQPNQDSENGVFSEYYDEWEFNTLNRIVVNVTKDDEVVPFARVELYKGETLEFSAVSDAKGKAYLFIKSVEESDKLNLKVIIGEKTVEQEITYSKNMPEVNIAVSDLIEKQDKLEIMFVVDTTGSMGDELNYLKAEVKNVINEIKLSNQDTDISVALLFYRDVGDSYVTKFCDFESDLENVKENISKQTTEGGGDFPEAVHTALSEAVDKQWSSLNSTKLIIHILDAPPHNNQEEMGVYEDSINMAAKKGIRMIPIASSGIDKATEYLLRNQAILTGGSYVFLTDESGIGNEHITPTIEGYVVEYLNALLVRVINEYHTGIHTEPIPYNQGEK